MRRKKGSISGSPLPSWYKSHFRNILNLFFWKLVELAIFSCLFLCRNYGDWLFGRHFLEAVEEARFELLYYVLYYGCGCKLACLSPRLAFDRLSSWAGCNLKGLFVCARSIPWIFFFSLSFRILTQPLAPALCRLGEGTYNLLNNTTVGTQCLCSARETTVKISFDCQLAPLEFWLFVNRVLDWFEIVIL